MEIIKNLTIKKRKSRKYI